MSTEFAKFTEQLVSISEFSQGKAGKIFSDVAENKKEYIVLKNNQPTAVLLSVEEYKETQQKLAMLERILEVVENMKLLKLADERAEDGMMKFEDFIEKEGFSLEELERLSECVEIE